MDMGIGASAANKAAEEALKQATQDVTKNARPEDVSRFESTMQSGQGTTATQDVNPVNASTSTPGDTILRNMGLNPVAPNAEMTPSQKLMESLQSFGSKFKETRENIKTRLEGFDKDPGKITHGDLFKLQNDLSQVNITLDIFAKGTDKVSRMIQTLIRGQ
ncbi:MAG: hypothetical protein A2Y14_01860 [Verrucomicrobia bacterium GWF2_51_19]|nr:MAG: hypothetical protein A2Y14_01860 [Verrucomicrobia bacterium GWF2_51_19]HCJ11895.1 hypothetical protein [Opitutae bacterium]